ncbi:MAG: fibrillarin-like rRNA/tRNA 2'-O-methyltransferase [Candidatus Diapherotrites archaeon]|nr:fibrillarin-like rRNA/tRNA 2'-O-methyltransferase [Candidatus Diapherotrites archaeon]
MLKLEKVFPGVWKYKDTLLTRNLVPGVKGFGSEMVAVEGVEYRMWNPYRSKLAAGIMNGLKKFPFKEGSKVLYLGSAEGTTISHVSDIVGLSGTVLGVDVSAKAMNKFLYWCEQRPNILPVLGDANQPESYKKDVKSVKVSLLYQDIAQKNQAEIFAKNARAFLGKKKKALLVVKADSIDAVRPSLEVIGEEIKRLEGCFDILQVISLEPFEKNHALVFCARK